MSTNPIRFKTIKGASNDERPAGDPAQGNQGQQSTEGKPAVDETRKGGTGGGGNGSDGSGVWNWKKDPYVMYSLWILAAVIASLLLVQGTSMLNNYNQGQSLAMAPQMAVMADAAIKMQEAAQKSSSQANQQSSPIVGIVYACNDDAELKSYYASATPQQIDAGKSLVVSKTGCMLGQFNFPVRNIVGTEFLIAIDSPGNPGNFIKFGKSGNMSYDDFLTRLNAIPGQKVRLVVYQGGNVQIN